MNHKNNLKRIPGRQFKHHPRKKKTPEELEKENKAVLEMEQEMKAVEEKQEKPDPIASINGTMEFQIDVYETQNEYFIRNKSVEAALASIAFVRKQLIEVMEREIEKRRANKPGMTNTLFKKHATTVDVLEFHATDLGAFLRKEETKKASAKKLDILIVPTAAVAEKIIKTEEDKSKVINFPKPSTQHEGTNEPEANQSEQNKGENDNRPQNPQ